MKRKGWLITVIVLLVALAAILISAPRILNITFEKATRILEQNFVKQAPPEYETRIRADFDNFIIAFKKNKIKNEALQRLSSLIKKANEDKKLTQPEIDEILAFIETIIGLK
ncbi:MAG: hypothetical protein QMD71_04360 [bacterium]|nr:hypothetical protein [bacterium]